MELRQVHLDDRGRVSDYRYMDLTNPGITYALMIIPSLFVLIVILQGIEKLVNHDPEGGVALGFGILFLVLIIAAYFLYIK